MCARRRAVATKPCPIPEQRTQAIQALRRELLLPRPPCPGLPNAPLRLGGDARAAAPNLYANTRTLARAANELQQQSAQSHIAGVTCVANLFGKQPTALPKRGARALGELRALL